MRSPWCNLFLITTGNNEEHDYFCGERVLMPQRATCVIELIYRTIHRLDIMISFYSSYC